MRPIRGNVNTLVDGPGGGAIRARLPVHEIAATVGVTCRHFDHLQDLVAKVGYYNPHHDIFLRGQGADFADPHGRSSLVATLFRVGSMEELDRVLEKLKGAGERLLVGCAGRSGTRALERFVWARWSLLQHYGVAPTPVVDVTRSPRIAASFATSGGGSDGYVYVIGLPYSNGNLTFDLATEVVIANLRNLMPPDARRPHWQQGYLVGSYPDELGWEPPGRRKADRIPPMQRHNLAQRLLCKVRIPAADLPSFWPGDNPPLPWSKLLPDEDPVREWITKAVVETTG